jgi:hypothetical protein
MKHLELYKLIFLLQSTRAIYLLVARIEGQVAAADAAITIPSRWSGRILSSLLLVIQQLIRAHIERIRLPRARRSPFSTIHQ